MTVTLRVEASFGTAVKPGDRVRKGDRVGIDPKLKQWVLSPIEGKVVSVEFDPETHHFIVKITEYE